MPNKETNQQKREKIIEIGCPPGNPRPDYYLQQVLKDTTIEPINTTLRSFGDWSWDFTNHVSEPVWEKHRDIIFQRLTALYDKGRIRYASVSPLEQDPTDKLTDGQKTVLFKEVISLMRGMTRKQELLNKMSDYLHNSAVFKGVEQEALLWCEEMVDEVLTNPEKELN